MFEEIYTIEELQEKSNAYFVKITETEAISITKEDMHYTFNYTKNTIKWNKQKKF